MGKIQEYSRNWLQRINRMPRDITGNIKTLQTNRQKRPGESIRDFWICETGTGRQVAKLHDEDE